MNEILYKYFPPERSGFKDGKLGFFPNLTVSFTCPTEFNDPFDCEPFITASKDDYIEFMKTSEGLESQRKAYFGKGEKRCDHDLRKSIKKLIKAVRRNPNWEKEYIEKAKRIWLESTKKNVRILSLAKEPDNILMWAHYSKNHEGFVVGIKKDFFILEESEIRKNGWGLKDVIYGDKKVILNTYKYNEEEWGLPFYNKSLHWKYENEVRFVGYDDRAPKFKLKNIPKEFVDSIILGIKMESALKTRIIDFCRGTLPGMKIFEASENLARYKIDLKKV